MLRSNIALNSKLMLFFIALISIFISMTMVGAQDSPDEPGGRLLRVPDVSASSIPVPASGRDFPQMQSLRQAAVNGGAVRVIVGLQAQAIDGVQFDQMAEAQQMESISFAQQAVMGRLSGLNVAEVQTFSYIPFMALSVDGAALEALAADPLVSFIQFDGLNVPATIDVAESSNFRKPLKADNSKYSGKGQVIAVIDTGIDKNHSYLRNRVVDEACYGTSYFVDQTFPTPILTVSAILSYNNTPTCIFNTSAVAGPNTALNCMEPGCDHGTAIAGAIIGKDNKALIPPDYNTMSIRGIAPDAKLIAVKVASKLQGSIGVQTPLLIPFLGLDKFLVPVCNFYLPINQVCAVAFDSDILAGMERAYSLRNKYDIAAVHVGLVSSLAPSEISLQALWERILEVFTSGGSVEDILSDLVSLGISLYEVGEQCDDNNPAYAAMVNKLTQAKIAVIAPTGDNNIDGRAAAPSCVTNTISVGATAGTGDEEGVWFPTNVVNEITLLAPGENIITSWPRNRYGHQTGTSIASAQVAGAWAVMKQVNKNASINTIKKVLASTGKPIIYSDTLTLKRIRVQQAVAKLLKQKAKSGNP